MNLCINKLASKIWEKDCASFLYTLYKARKSQSQHFPFILDQFSFVSNAMNFFIHSLNRFVLYLWVADFLQSGALYATITHDPTSKYNWWKSEHNEHQRSLWVWGVLRSQQSFRRQSPLGSFLAFKWHLDWLKIDLNVAEIITV